MGLDMYLSKWKLHGYSVENAIAVDNWLDWQEHLKEIRSGKSDSDACTFEDWCGKSEDEVTPEMIETLKPEWKTRYYSWDTEHKYPHNMIYTPLASWRKANAIHNWFVQNVQHGVDDCGEYVISRGDLEELRRVCQKILDEAVMKPGKVHNGDRLVNGNWEPMYEDGEVVINPEVCETYLPSQGGFFFGSTDYDHYYIEDIKDTINIIDRVMKEVNWETETVSYSSSW